MNPLSEVDAQISLWFHAQATPALTEGMLFVTQLHGTLGISLLALVLAGVLYVRKEGYWLLTLAVVLPAGMLINVLLKNLFMRARPSFNDSILTLTSYSFPSGHVAGSTMFYGVLAAFLCSGIPSWRGRMFVASAACAMVALVAVTRLYLGVHYFSDVVGAAAWSTAWLALCLHGVNTLKRRRRL